MKDIAEACGVSLSTVSLVLNENPRISTETRAKVMAAMDKFGYQPDIHARGLALRSSQSLSVVVPQINHIFADVYFGEIVSGIYDRAAQEKYKILLDVSNTNFIESQEYLNILKSRRADGMLFIASSMYDKFLQVFEGGDYPFLLVNNYFPESNLNYISANYEDTARQAAEHLIGLGHRKIGLVTGTNVQTAVEFRYAFESFCHHKGVSAKDLPWADGDFREEGGFEAARRLLSEHPELTAVMAGNDKMAIGAMRYLLSSGRKVPADVSVMGVDDIPAARYTTPGLTTIRHDLYGLGQKACERVLSLFRGEISTCKEVLAVELVARESTGPAPQKQSG